MINLQEVKILQGSILHALYSKKFKIGGKKEHVIAKLIDLPVDVLQDIFGELGPRLKNFANAVNSNHKGMHSAFMPGLKLVDEIIETTKFLRKKEFNLLAEEVKNITSKLGKDAEMKRLDNPALNNHYIRFLESAEQRVKLRQNKSSHIVELQSFYKRGSWESHPNNFALYKRHDTAYAKELQRIKNKADQYLQLGCTELYEGIASVLRDAEEVFADTYLGFHRITMTSAAVIAAKLHQFAFTKLEVTHRNPYKCLITVSINSFVGYPLVKQTIYSPNSFVYQPRIYPYHTLQDIAPDEVVKVIDYLENNESLNGAAFDHYIILVPGIEYCKETIDLAHQNYENIENVTEHLDKVLIKRGNLVPILLGERDGKCYFISYWV